ncbi:MAG: heavy metal translocating P-type ATPase, partial [Erysipelotrichaceae bacterium]
ATIGAFIIGEFAEGAAVMIFYAIGEIFQSYAVNKSRNSISSLMDINADHANLLVNDIIKVVDPKDVAIGDIIVLKSGERVPLDGICLSDNGTLDCSALSGESIPINIERNSNVLAGSINLSNTIKLEVTKDYSNSSVARILELVENASNNKAPSVDFITRFAKIYTPIVVIAALLLALIPPLLNIGTLNEWIYRACIFLVVSCPCALVISIPLALFAGLGSASSKGILIKGGNYLEALANIDTIVFDKTGTLTKGTFSVNNVVSLDIDKDELLKIAAYGESMSTHPIAKSIVEYYNKPINNKLITNIEEISGKGIKCIMFDHTYFLGNASLMFSNGYNNLLDNDNTCVHIMQDNEYLGYISVSDELKTDSKLAIKELKSLGIKKCIMLSGDKASVVKMIANELCLDASYGQLLPGDKVAKLEEFMSSGRVAFVGDGINDAPVLARSDIGIAMGAMGSEAAIQAADVVLMNDTPTSIVTAIKISTKTKSILYQNIVLSLGIKLIVLVLATLGIASMWLGVFADVGVTLLAVLNSMRALTYKD